MPGKPINDLLLSPEMPKKESNRHAKIASFKKGASSLILPNQKVSLLKPSMSSIAIRKCGLEKIEDGLDEAQSRI